MRIGVRIGWLVGVLAILLGMMASASAPASAQGNDGRSLDVCVLPAKPGMTAAALFADPARFDCTTPQANYGSGGFWVLSQPLPTDLTAQPGLGARSASLWQSRLTLHVLYADGAIRRIGFDSGNASRYLSLGATFSLPLPHHGTLPTRLLWHIEGSANLRGTLLGAALTTPDQRARRTTFLAAFYGCFAGMAIALIVYNLALWGALRQSFQPAYCALVLCLLFYAFSSSAALGMAAPWLDNNIRLRINTMLLASSLIAVFIFARAFFERRVFDGWLRPASSFGMAALAGSVVLFAVLAPSHMRLLDRTMLVFYTALIGLVPVILWRAWRTQSKYLLMFALAWGVPIVFAGLRIASSLDLLPWSFWLDNSTIVSMMLEALLSSLAIAYRIRQLSRERDEAREQEIAARLLADTDPLTGLLNRRAFLSHAIGRPGDQVLLLADLDHFKRVNETIGHDGGDEALRVFSRVLRASIPADALIARIGGEEFAIIAHASSELSASLILDRLRSSRMPFDLAITASIGACTGPLLRETDWKALYRSADRALFAAKAAGRDRVRVAEDISKAA